MHSTNKQLIELISSVIDLPPKELDMDSGPANQTSWDSLAHVTIVAAVEETYGLKLTLREILEIKTIRDLDRIIMSEGK